MKTGRAMQTCSNELRWALADNEKSPVSELRTGSFSDLAQLVTNHAVSPHKEGPAWLPANIQPGRRSSEKAGSWGVLALDVERKKDFTDPAPPVLDVAKTADMWGMSAAIATSYSHAMHDPRYRVVLEVNRPILTHEIERLARVVAGLLGVSDHLDTGCFDPARLFYLPRVPADRWDLKYGTIIKGRPLEVDSLLEQAVPVTPARHASQPALTPESALSCLRAALTDLELLDLRSATMYLASVGYGSTYETWQPIGAALHSEAHGGRAAEVLALWLDFCRACGGFISDADALEKWNRIGDKSSKAAIFSKATARGWINPAIGRKRAVETAPIVPNANRYKLVSGKELRELPPTEWCIRGVFPATGIVAVYGPSGSGKSFLAFDMAAAIAEGRSWFDCRVKAAPVVYVPLEGAAGFKRRSKAWEFNRRRDLPDGLGLMMQPMHLTTPQDVEDLAAIVPPGAVVFIDTLNRATPGCDENSSKDMGMILEAVNRLQSLTGGLVVLIHHTGKDAERGMRGHSSMFAAMDAVVEVKRDKANPERRGWSVAKSKDDEDGKSHSFKLVAVQLENDSDGQVVTSCVVEPTASFAEQPKLSSPEQVVLDALLKTDPSGSGVTRDQLRAATFEALDDKTPDAKRTTLKRGIDGLVAAGRVSEVNGQLLAVSTLFNAA